MGQSLQALDGAGWRGPGGGVASGLLPLPEPCVRSPQA